MEEEKKVSDRIENRKLLREQLKLLAEKSKSKDCSVDELIALSEGMVKIYEILTLRI